MNLDIQTLMVTMATTLVVMSIALPVIMGWRNISRAAHCAQLAMGLQALGWLAMLGSRFVFDRGMSTLSITCMSASSLAMWHAFNHWLGPRPGRRVLEALTVLTPLGYGLGFGHYAFRVGWSNFGLAAGLLTVCLALAWPAPQASRRWRGLVLICMLAMATVTAWRGVLGAFFTSAYPYFMAPHPVNLASGLISNITLALSAVGLLVAWREEAERALRQQAQTDGLTGLLNRRAFSQRAVELLALAQRQNQRVSLLMLDLDHFKLINDHQGHAMGDRALQLAAAVLQATLRRGDLACRWGGEEFCVLMVHGDEAAARLLDHRLRQALRRRSAAELGFAVDYSAGLAIELTEAEGLDELLRRADAALYLAKDSGRGRLMRAGEDLPAADDDAPPPALRPYAERGTAYPA